MTKKEREQKAIGFPAFLENFTADNVLSDAAFSATFNASDDFELQGRIRMHKQAAMKRGIPSREYERMLKAYEKTRNAKAAGSIPSWLTKDGLDERLFLDEFNSCKGYRCINGRLYLASQGYVSDDEVAAEIQRELETALTTQLQRKTRELLGALKNRCQMNPPPAEPDKVYFRFGYYNLTDNTYHPEIGGFTFYRLTVDYQPDPPPPVKWFKYLDDLLDHEDIMTFQEFCGYAMIPTTRAQKMLFIIGNGGEGKSVAGQVLMSIFGAAATSGRLHDLEERFGLAGLEGKLLFIDDDLPTAALKESASVKKVVTTNTPILIERKGRDQYPAQLYCRILCFGNQLTDSLYDHSNGAFRRRLILTTKGRDPNREDDPQLAEKIIEDELPGVARWMLDGLKRLKRNGWKFTTSEKQRMQEQRYREDSFNLLAFLKDADWVTFDRNGSVTSRELYAGYQQWCSVNGEEPLAQRTVSNYLKSNAKQLNIRASEHMVDRTGIRARGYRGIILRDLIPIAI